MKLRELVKVMDLCSPVWLNIWSKEGENEVERYDNSGEIPFGYARYKVVYVTLDGNKEFTIEITEEE